MPPKTQKKTEYLPIPIPQKRPKNTKHTHTHTHTQKYEQKQAMAQELHAMHLQQHEIERLLTDTESKLQHL